MINGLRTVLLFVCILTLFLIGSVRVAVINDDGSIAAAAENNSTVITVSQNRGRIFDCNGVALTGEKIKNYAVITPSEQTISYCKSVLTGDEKISVLGKLRNRKAAVIETENEMNCAGIINLKVPVLKGEDSFCAHLLGYTDSSFHGVTGLEKAMDEYLYSDSKISVRLYTDAYGRVLSGIEPKVEQDRLSTSGVITTIDKNVQIAVENATKDLSKGAVVVGQAGTGKIRAMVSKPSYNPSAVEEVMSSESSPLLNRALQGYNVGSAFKPCIAVANADSDLTVECSGSVLIDGNHFACHKSSGHGTVDMREALTQSCNSYFYRFALMQGADKIYETATLFGFGINKTLCNGISTKGEKIPSRSTLSSERALANFSIGQGELLASPVSMLTLYEAIACDGVYHIPSIIEGVMENAIITEKTDEQPPTKAMSKQQSQILKSYLVDVVNEGTGKAAFSDRVSVAGKTSTAQTGWKNSDGTVKTHSWFCGFFPVEEPSYVVAVLVEDSANSTVTAAQIFSYIATALG
ncbi:MAG: penicillin-binding protein 2 [Acutalibacteraceae bacterium]|nr:penicillin-binding protein 2 [Acutalibacteraceae bacterium]